MDKIIKQLPAAINRRISDLSCNREAFERAKPCYEKVLKSCGYKENMSYISEIPPSTRKEDNMVQPTIQSKRANKRG